jgi:hypothetical protein
VKKSVAGQVVGAQMVSATDGSAFTSAVTVSVTGDGGTQATGSVGSGACTHEGNGFHTYAPAQAETNYDHVAFTFTGSGAVPATVQIYTTFPQTGDSFARVGAPVGASISADVAAVKAVLPSALVSGRIDASVGAMAANVLTATAIAADAITDAKVASDVTIASVTGAVGSIASGGITAASFAADAITAAKVAADVGTEIGTAVWGHHYALAYGRHQYRPGQGNRRDGVQRSGRRRARSAVGLASANLDTQIATLATAANLSTVAGYLDTEVAATLAIANKLDTAMELDGAVYRFTTNALELAPAGGAGLDAAGVRAALGLASANLDTQLDALPTNAELATALGTADDAVLTVVNAIKTKTDSLTFTVANQLDANIQSVNSANVTGDGQPGSEWGP